MSHDYSRAKVGSGIAILVLVALAIGVTATSLLTRDHAEPTSASEPVRDVPESPAAAECPFIDDYGDYDLPERMSPAQIEACQAYLAGLVPDRRFSPGSPWFSTQVCASFEARDPLSREAECRNVRIAVCRLAVQRGAFTSMRACFSATPPRRVIVHERSPRISVRVTEPAVFDGFLYFNVLDEWFPGRKGRAAFSAPRAKAWDSASSRVVPFPRDLVDFIARSPYVEVMATRTVRLGGVAAREIDLVVRRGDPNARRADLCGEQFRRDIPCLPISADPNDEGYVSLWLSPGDAYRLIDLRTRSGRLIVWIDAFETFRQLAAAERVLRTLRVG